MKKVRYETVAVIVVIALVVSYVSWQRGTSPAEIVSFIALSAGISYIVLV